MAIQNRFYRLHCEEVSRIIRDQDLKMWWVAEKAGIHKTTLRRWLSGEIRAVRDKHLEQLALVLDRKRFQIGEPVN